jgi:cytochrome P450
MLAFLLHNPSLIETIRQETAQAFEGGELVNHEHLVDHSLCPHLEAVWLETLRLISNGSAVRCVNEDTVVGDMLFRKGNKVIIPYRLLHMNENAYQQDPEQFIPNRFLEKENRTRGGYWRPFGGGKTLCTGRFVAEQSIKACICTILHRFDLEIIGGAPLPEGDVGTPGLGIMGIKAGEDFSVKISERA